MLGAGLNDVEIAIGRLEKSGGCRLSGRCLELVRKREWIKRDAFHSVCAICGWSRYHDAGNLCNWKCGAVMRS